MAKGRPWKVFIGLMDEEPYEVFAVNGKIDRIPIDKGILRKIKQGRYDLISLSGEVIVEDITHNMTQDEEAFTRTISWALRHGAKLEFGIEQLSKSQGDITSFSKAIARTLKKYIKDGMVSTNINCPNCGSILSSDGGCWVCKQCGYSKCE
jgi:ribosomal protein S27AE